MAIGKTNAGGGGTSLNFDVKRYSTKAELLAATSKENTIGIISEHEMTGWIIDFNQPEELTEGMVWIPVGTYSAVEFNALKKNTIQVYPLSAKQMVSGALVNVEAMSYQGGEWVEWITYLYREGNQCVDITGGWSDSGLLWSGSTAPLTPVTVGEKSITLPSSSSQASAVATVNNVNLAKINTLCMRYTSNGTHDQMRFGVMLGNEVTYGHSSFNSPANAPIPIATNGILEVDVSNVNSGRIFATCYNGVGATLSIHDVWGE